MTEAQYEGFTTITANNDNDTITIAGGAITDITTNSNIGTYVIGEDTNGNNVTVTVAATDDVNITSDSTDDVITAQVAGTYTGTINTNNSANTNVLSLTATADISTATIDANFDNLTIADGATATMTEAQYEGFTTITANNDNDTITIAGGAITDITTNSNIGTYVIGEDTNGNNVTVTVAATDDVNITSDSTDDVITAQVAGTYTGRITVGDVAGDTLSLTATADISGANIDTDMDFLTIANGATVTMTKAQYASFTGTITAGGSAEGITISDESVAIGTGHAAIETYTTANGTNSITLGASGQNVTGGTGADTVAFSADTAYTGTIALAAGTNVITLASGSDIGGATVTAAGGTINFTIASGSSVTMDDATHDLLVAGTLTAAGTETITISDAATITTDALIENYSVAEGANVTSGSLAQVITETGSNSTVSTFTLGAGTYTGDWVGIDATDVVKVVDNTNIAGNTGLNAGAIIDFQNASATITLNDTQNGVVTFANAANAQTVSISAVDTFTTVNTIETYSGIGGGTVTLGASHATANITMDNTAATTLNVGAQTVTGTYSLGHSSDVLKVTADADISGINDSQVTTAETLDVSTVGQINTTMTEAQYEGFTTITANNDNDTITIAGGAITDITTNSNIGTYVIGEDTNGNNVTVTVAATDDVNITSDSTDDVITAQVAGTYTGTINTNNSANTNVLSLTATADISTATIDANFDNLTIADGATATMTEAQYASFGGTITAAGTETVVFSGASTGQTANANIERYTFDDATNSFTAHANTTVLTGGTGADTFIMGTNMDSAVTINGAAGVDVITMTNQTANTNDLDNVTNVETITLGEAATSITSVDGLVANGATLTVNGSGIGANEFVFDGSAEQDGKFVLTGSAGATVLTGGSGDDIFNLASDNFDASDSFDGSTGSDTVNITGNTVIVNADIDSATFENIDVVTFANTTTDITWTIAADEVDNDISITASSTSGIVTIDGTLESNALTITSGSGNDIITGGSGNDVITGNAGNDVITGGTGADIITGGAGADDIVYTALGASIATDGHAFDGTDTDGVINNITDASDDLTESTSSTAGAGDYIIGFTSLSDQILINGDLEAALEANGATSVVSSAGIDFDAVGIAIVDNGVATVADFGDISDVATAITASLVNSSNANAGDEIVISLAKSDNSEHGVYYFRDADGSGTCNVGDSLGLLAIAQYSGDLTSADIIA